MSHHDKFWEKFGWRIRQHQPEAYTDGEWNDMEQLLNGATQPPRRKNRALLPLILLAAVAGYLAGAWYGWPSTPETIGAFPIPMQGIARGEMPVSTPNNQTDKLTPLRNSVTEPRQLPSIEKSRRLPSPVSGEERGSVAVEGSTIVATPAVQKSLPGSAPVHLPEHISHADAAARNPGSLLSRLPILPVNLVQRQTTEQPIESTVFSEKKSGRFFGGFLLGGNLSAIGPQNVSYSSYPFGGLFAGIRIGRRWAIQAEAQVKYVDNLSLAYEQTERLESNNGFYFDQSSRGVTEKNYLALEMPLAVKYRLRPTWSFLAGISPSFILENVGSDTRQDDEAAMDATLNAGQGRGSTSNEPRLRQFDLGVAAGLEWAFHRRWSIDARFTQGLLDLSPDGMFQENVKHLNTSFQLSARYKFQ